MVRTDHLRLAAGAVLGAITAALFAEGLIAGAPEQPADRATVAPRSAPEPLPAVAESTPPPTQPITATTTTTTQTSTTTTTTTTKRSSTTTTTTTIPQVTTTTTTRRTCRLLC